VNGLIMFQDG